MMPRSGSGISQSHWEPGVISRTMLAGTPLYRFNLG